MNFREAHAQEITMPRGLKNRAAIQRPFALLIFLLMLTATTGSLGKDQGVLSASDFHATDTASLPNPSPERGSTPAVTWSRFSAPHQQNTAYVSCVIADINMDAHMDIIAGHSMGIHIWTGDGNGNWDSFTAPASTLQFNDLKVGDLNNDGKPDIVGASDNGLFAWTGNGNGTWTDISPTFDGRKFYATELHDINLDGRLDIIAGSRGQGNNKAVCVYLNDGAGGWTRGDANMPTAGNYYDVAVGDFNMDGKPDIAAAASNGVHTWAGDGNGGWNEIFVTSAGMYSNVKFSDFNADGKPDLVAASQNNGGVKIWSGNGAGTWIPLLTSKLPSSNGNYGGVETADINIDGYIDIVTVSSNSDSTVWTGDGLDNWYLQTEGMEIGNYHTSISQGDINRDGRTDFCMITENGAIEIWISQVEREVNSWNEFPAPNTTGINRDVHACDIDRDGKIDVIYALNGKGLEIWKGDGNGTWNGFPSPITNGNFNNVLAIDFNKDGKQDIIATSDAGVRSWRGDGVGGWSESSTSTTNVWLGLAAADLNNDGNIDFVAGTGTNQGLRQFNGNGVGGWIPRPVLPFTGNYYAMDIADMNRDGAKDIVAANGGIKVFLGNGNDVWTDSSSGLPGTTENYRNVKAADINNDGIMDIIGVSTTAGVNAWLGDGTGQWTAYSNIVPSHGAGLAVADFSIDGKLDICTGSAIGTGLAGRKNDGTTWNDVSMGLASLGNYTALELADINIDGRMDIITFNNSDGTPRIWTGDYLAPPTPSFSIGPLNVGWNMVSFPLVPVNASLPGALSDMDGDTSWTVLKSYDNVQKKWLTYRMGGTANTIFEMDNMMGAWLYIPDAGALGDGYIRIEGELPTSTVINLVTGWNLVGYPSLDTALATEILPLQVDILSEYQSASPYVQDHTLLTGITLNPGSGYWLHITSDCTWNID